MALNVNSAYALNGIDLNSVNNTAKQILKSADVKAIDYSKFNRASQGIDLYSARTNVELQRQIALTQAGLYVQSINVSQLNSNAAANLYSSSSKRAVEAFENASDKNSGSSHGFNPFSNKKDDEAKK